MSKGSESDALAFVLTMIQELSSQYLAMMPTFLNIHGYSYYFGFWFIKQITVPNSTKFKFIMNYFCGIVVHKEKNIPKS